MTIPVVWKPDGWRVDEDWEVDHPMWMPFDQFGVDGALEVIMSYYSERWPQFDVTFEITHQGGRPETRFVPGDPAFDDGSRVCGA